MNPVDPLLRVLDILSAHPLQRVARTGALAGSGVLAADIVVKIEGECVIGRPEVAAAFDDHHDDEVGLIRDRIAAGFPAGMPDVYESLIYRCSSSLADCATQYELVQVQADLIANLCGHLATAWVRNAVTGTHFDIEDL